MEEVSSWYLTKPLEIDRRTPRVSVAIATYNQEALVSTALDSALAQDYPDLQVVVGDDGSTDHTPAILEGYRRRYPDRIKLLLSPTNRGITANYNAILAACDGQYVARLDGDDLFKPGKIRAQVEVLDAQPQASVCHHPVEWFDGETGATISVVNRGVWRSADDAVCRGTFGSGPSVMHRRNAAPAHGFRTELPCASDLMFYIELALAGEVVTIDEPLARYRFHDQQVCRSPAVFRDCLRTLEMVEAEGLARPRIIARGRANVMHWEAINRQRAGADRATVRTLLMKGLRSDPTYAPLWKRLVKTYAGEETVKRLHALKSLLARQRRAHHQ